MSAKKSSMGAELARLSAEGRYDSQGSFTTSKQRLVLKLGSSQLSRQSAWLLKMVQAGVAAGAQAIAVKQTRRHTQVTLRACKGLPVAALGECLSDAKAKPEGAVGHLAVGLRAVGMGQRRAFTVVGADGKLRWEPETAELNVVLESRAAADLTIKVEFPEGEVGRYLGFLFRALGRATDEYLDLVYNADACPVPLTFDGRRLDAFDCPVDGKSYLVEPLVKGWIEQPHEGLPVLSIPARALKRGGADALIKASLMYKLHRHAQSDGPGGAAPCSRLSWLIDGVIGHYEETKLSGTVTCEFYLSAEGLRTDLSGMTLVNSAAKNQRMKAAFAAFLPRLRQIEDEWRHKVEIREKSWTKMLDRKAHASEMRELRACCSGLGHLARQLERAAER